MNSQSATPDPTGPAPMLNDAQLARMNARLADAPCRKCGTTGQLRIELREELHAKPLGTFSLAGAQPKVSATLCAWPWMVCGACGRDSRGSLHADSSSESRGS